MEQDSDNGRRNPNNFVGDVQFTQSYVQSKSVNKPARDGCSASSCSWVETGACAQDVPAASGAPGVFWLANPSTYENFHSLHPAGLDRRTEKNKDDHLSNNQRSSWFNPGSHEGAVHRQDPYFRRSPRRRLEQS